MENGVKHGSVLMGFSCSYFYRMNLEYLPDSPKICYMKKSVYQLVAFLNWSQRFILTRQKPCLISGQVFISSND